MLVIATKQHQTTINMNRKIKEGKYFYLIRTYSKEFIDCEVIISFSFAETYNSVHHLLSPERNIIYYSLKCIYSCWNVGSLSTINVGLHLYKIGGPQKNRYFAYNFLA